MQGEFRTKQRSRKRLAGLSALAVTGLVLAGCAGPSENDDSGVEGDTVTIWSFSSGDEQAALEADFEPLFKAKHPDAKLKWVFVPLDQFKTKIVAAAGAKSGPDVIVGASRDFPTMYGAGGVADITEQWDAFDGRSEFSDAFVMRNGDEAYGIRTKGETTALWYNQDILDKVGVEVPKTWEELDTAFKAVHDAGFTAFGICGQPTGGCEWESRPWLSGSGFLFDNPDEASLTSGFSLMEKWVNAGYIPRDAVTWDQSIPFQQFLGGNMAFVQTGNWNIATAAEKADFRYGIEAIPSGPAGGGGYLGGEVVFIGAFAKNPKLAWSFLESTFLSEEGQLAVFKSTGSLPARVDASADPSITSNPYLPPFVEALAKASPNPPVGVDPMKSSAAQLIVGQLWSAVIGQQKSSAEAAKEAVAGVKAAFQ